MAKLNQVVVEIMPDYLRASHRAANNFGTYPNNGAVRYSVDIITAEHLCDGDEYNFITNEDPDDYPYEVLCTDLV